MPPAPTSFRRSYTTRFPSEVPPLPSPTPPSSPPPLAASPPPTTPPASPPTPPGPATSPLSPPSAPPPISPRPSASALPLPPTSACPPDASSSSCHRRIPRLAAAAGLPCRRHRSPHASSATRALFRRRHCSSAMRTGPGARHPPASSAAPAPVPQRRKREDGEEVEEWIALSLYPPPLRLSTTASSPPSLLIPSAVVPSLSAVSAPAGCRYPSLLMERFKIFVLVSTQEEEDQETRNNVRFLERLAPLGMGMERGVV